MWFTSQLSSVQLFRIVTAFLPSLSLVGKKTRQRQTLMIKLCTVCVWSTPWSASDEEEDGKESNDVET